ncbi:hypothetical protein [Sporosarcina sp. Marseille-Q4943]|uniref:hypothetical protein n=1 Tax=Sporosarcina sp. Marseille-Q4943 TaxID=2942204 RepID=UPI00208DDA27|nr:hypothetical protein [Sporosarcina sp. Marseille-Q4943]
MKDVLNLSREELLENVNQTLGLLNKFMAVDSSIRSFYKSTPDIYEKIAVIVAFISFLPLIMFGVNVMRIFDDWFLGILVGFPLGVAMTWFLFVFIRRKLEGNFKIKQKQYLEDNYEKIQALNVELGGIAETVFRTTVVPEDYVTRPALEKFSSYLSNYRASNLPECINLYENELQAQQMRDEINQFRQEQQRTTDMLSKARSELSNTNRHLSEANVKLGGIEHEAYKSNFHR